jgi:hypothetical protein
MWGSEERSSGGGGGGGGGAEIELFGNIPTAIRCLNCNMKVFKPVKRVSPITLLLHS